MYHWYLPYVLVGKNLISNHSCLHFLIPGISKQYVFVEAMKNTTRDATIRQYVFRSAYTSQSEMVHTTSTWAPKKNQRIHEYVCTFRAFSIWPPDLPRSILSAKPHDSAKREDSPPIDMLESFVMTIEMMSTYKETALPRNLRSY